MSVWLMIAETSLRRDTKTILVNVELSHFEDAIENEFYEYLQKLAVMYPWIQLKRKEKRDVYWITTITGVFSLILS